MNTQDLLNAFHYTGSSQPLPNFLQGRRLVVTTVQPRYPDESVEYIARDLETGEMFRITASQASRLQQQESSSAPNTQPLNENNLVKESYDTFIKQLYGLPVQLPEYLIINGLRVNFIPFEQIGQIQIERYILDPLVQPWAGPPTSPNRILTIFDRNGVSYLVKARYDQATHQIFLPV